MDVVTPVVLYDTTVNGRPRKGIAVLRTDGYLFLLDRVDGSPLLPIEERPVPQDPFQTTSPTQPFPVGGDQVVPNCVEPWLMPPGFKSGCYFTPLNQPNLMVPYIGTRQAPMAYSPETGYFYIAASVNPFWATRFGISIGTWTAIVRAGVCPRLPHQQDRLATANAVSAGVWRGHVGDSGWRGISRRRGRQRAGARCQDGRTPLAVPDRRWRSLRAVYHVRAGSANSTLPWHQVAARHHRADQEVRSRPETPCGRSSSEGGSNSCRRRRRRRSCRHSRVAASLPGRTRSSSISRNGTRTPSDRLDFESMSTRPSSRAGSGCPAGTRVTWKNTGHEPHTISVRGQRWTTGPIKPDATGSIQFDVPGTYVFSCDNHPWQQGEITVGR